MADNEKATPVTPDEADDIRVTLELDEGEVECSILTIYEAGGRDYIALMPLDSREMRQAMYICTATPKTKKDFRASIRSKAMRNTRSRPINSMNS